MLAKYPNLNQVPFNAAPIGTGPYKFVRWSRGDQIVLGANDAYFKGAPAIKQVDLKIISDANTTQSQIRSHEVDLALQITAPTYNALADDVNIVRQPVSAPVFSSVMFNVARAPLDDRTVRRAIGLAIDKQSILKTDTFGTADLARADLSPFSWGYDASLAPIPYDPAQAKTLLDGDGWRPGPDGIRRKDGRRLTLQFAIGAGSDIARNISVQVQQMLKAVGIDVQVRSYDYAMFYGAAESGGILLGGKYDMAFFSWVSGADPDDSSLWSCAARPPGGNNSSFYCSAEMDRAQADALSTFDPATRKKAYARIQALLLRDAPQIFLYYRKLLYAHVPELKHFTPNGITEGWNAYEWNKQQP